MTVTTTCDKCGKVLKNDLTNRVCEFLVGPNRPAIVTSWFEWDYADDGVALGWRGYDWHQKISKTHLCKSCLKAYWEHTRKFFAEES